jgi:hypothetical protein
MYLFSFCIIYKQEFLSVFTHTFLFTFLNSFNNNYKVINIWVYIVQWYMMSFYLFCPNYILKL